MVYSFQYDSIGRNTRVNIGSQNIITNIYEPNGSNLLESDYGNGAKVSTDYDNMDRVVSKKVNGTEIAHYTYNSSGNLGILEDKTNNVTYKYIYDLAERLIKVTDSNGNSFKSGYDLNNNVNQETETINGKTLNTDYEFNKDNRVTKISPNYHNKDYIDYYYDSLGRIGDEGYCFSERGTDIDEVYTIYQYDDNKDGTTSNRIKSVQTPAGFDSANGYIYYTYDENGNIETITKEDKLTNKDTLTQNYDYNELNELKREDNKDLNKTIVYSYDAGGNLKSKTEYPYTTDPTNLGTATATINYEYGDSNWKDKLTGYNGKAITYDAIGNPLTYNGYTYSWQAGRQLAGISGNGKNISYKYNADGIRTEKNVNGVITKYVSNGSDVEYEETTNGSNVDKIYYCYNSSGKLEAMLLNGVEYFYIRNAQNDIIGLLDQNDKTAASYTYDTWGKLISIKDGDGKDITNDTTSAGYKNPYRYRGYRYDAETGLYYLQSRYCSPEWGRFINADGIVGQTGELLSHNMFSYCKNNPVNMYDSDGCLPKCINNFFNNVKNTLKNIGNAIAGAASGIGGAIVTSIVDATKGTSLGPARSVVSAATAGSGYRDMQKNIKNDLRTHAKNVVSIGTGQPNYKIEAFSNKDFITNQNKYIQHCNQAYITAVGLDEIEEGISWNELSSDQQDTLTRDIGTWDPQMADRFQVYYHCKGFEKAFENGYGQ